MMGPIRVICPTRSISLTATIGPIKGGKSKSALPPKSFAFWERPGGQLQYKEFEVDVCIYRPRQTGINW